MTAAEQPTSAGRLPSLDGIRAIAVGLVILSHIQGYGSGYIPGLWRWDLGNLGVRIFFVLSGFLITSLLVSELASTNDISLRNFYLRRAFRIFPAFYVMLAVMVVVWRLGLVELNWASVALTGLYLSNMVVGRGAQISAPIGHAWSLAVEEQFYLLWPAALKTLKPKRAVMFLVAIILLAPIPRLLLDLGGYTRLARYSFPTVMDALAVGALLALTRDRLARWKPFVAFTTSRWGAAPIFLIPILALSTLPVAFRDTVGILLLNLSIGLILQWTLAHRTGPVYRVLNTPLAAYLGRASYSIYLWQSPVLTQGADIPLWLGLPLIGVASLGSYHLVEQPFLRLRGRWSRSRTRPAPDEEPALASSAVA